MTITRWPASQHYEFCVAGELRDDWYDWLDGFEVVVHDGATTLSGEVSDQAALYGIIARFAALGLTLLSVQSIDPTAPRIARNLLRDES